MIPSHDGCEEESDKGGKTPDKGHVTLAHLMIMITIMILMILIIPMMNVTMIVTVNMFVIMNVTMIVLLLATQKQSPLCLS